MELFLQSAATTEGISSPPSTPPPYISRPLQRQRSSYILDTSSSTDHNNNNTIMDKVRLDYIGRVKSTFQHLTWQQRHFFLTEILGCCDNQLLQYIYTFITPKLKIDFLKELPIELSLYVLSFIDNPKMLARASLVSRHWNALLKDEGAWKQLCLKHQYRTTTVIHATSSATAAQAQALNPLSSLARQQQETISYRDFFRRKYNIEQAWNSGGGKITECQDGQIGDGLATSLQMDDAFIVIGCDNNHIEVFDANNGKYIRSLLGHEGGVWALQFIKNQQDNQHILVTGGCDRYFITLLSFSLCYILY